MTSRAWEIREIVRPLAGRWTLTWMTAIGLASVAVAIVEPSLWYLALLAIVVVVALLGAVRERRQASRRQPRLVIRANVDGLTVGWPEIQIPWSRVISVSAISYDDKPYLRVEVAAPYKLVKMRSKKLREWSPHVWSFNGQPVNISTESLDVSLEEIRRQIESRMPSARG